MITAYCCRCGQKIRKIQNKDRNDSIFTDYRNGLPVPEIAIKYGLTRETIRNTLKKYK